MALKAEIRFLMKLILGPRLGGFGGPKRLQAIPTSSLSQHIDCLEVV